MTFHEPFRAGFRKPFSAGDGDLTPLVTPVMHLPLTDMAGNLDMKGVATVQAEVSNVARYYPDNKSATGWSMGSATACRFSTDGVVIESAATYLARKNDDLLAYTTEWEAVNCTITDTITDPTGTTLGFRCTADAGAVYFGVKYKNTHANDFDQMSMFMRSGSMYQYDDNWSPLMCDVIGQAEIAPTNVKADNKWNMYRYNFTSAPGATAQPAWLYINRALGAESTTDMYFDIFVPQFCLVGDTGNGSDAGPRPVKNTTAVSLAPTKDQLTYDGAALPDFNGTDWTIALEVTINQNSALTRRFLHRDATPNLSIAVNANEGLQVNFSGSSNAGTNALLTVGTRHRILVTYDASATTLKAYLNGVEDISNGAVTDAAKAAGNTYIGMNQSAAQQSEGTIRNVRYWNEIITWQQAFG